VAEVNREVLRDYRALFDAIDAFMRAGDEESANEIAAAKNEIDRRLGHRMMRWELDESLWEERA
jgi:hypothetical protein